MYRNLRPYFKITMPSIPLQEAEVLAWKSGGTCIEIQKSLQAAQARGGKLSALAIEVAGAAEIAQYEDDISIARVKLPVRFTVCTCVCSLAVEQDDTLHKKRLIACTESGYLCLFQQHSAMAQLSINLGGVPSMMAVTGTLVTGWRAAIALRDGRIVVLRDGKLLPTSVKCNAAITGLGWIEPSIDSGDRHKSIIIATANGCVRAVSAEGKTRWSVDVAPAAISSAASFEQLSSTNVDSAGVLIGTTCGLLYTIVQGKLVSKLKLGSSSSDAIEGIAFGNFGREGNSAIVTTSSGALHVLVLKRGGGTALKRLARKGVKRGDMVGCDPSLPLAVPRKSRLFVAAAEREKRIAGDMHETFQRDILRLKLSAARSYVRLAATGLGPTAVVGSASNSTSVRLASTLAGISDHFRLSVVFHCTGKQPLQHLALVASPSSSGVSLHPAVVQVPLLLPGTALHVHLLVFVNKHKMGPLPSAQTSEHVTLSLIESTQSGKQWEPSSATGGAAVAMQLHGVPQSSRPILSAIQRLPLEFA